MECKDCKSKMKLVLVWDDAQMTDHAFNLFACEKCGLLCKEDVWEDEGKRWIALTGEIVIEES